MGSVSQFQGFCGLVNPTCMIHDVTYLQEGEEPLF